MFEEAASNHTIGLHEAYEYMSGIRQLPTWEPYIRITTMLKELGHDIKGHSALGSKTTLDKI
jgi:hypothetical protein